MKIYCAAVYTSNLYLHGAMFNRLDERERKARQGVRFTLESYHYVHKESSVEKMRRDGTRIFLDSGAFSAFMLGSVIDLDGYIAYIKKNADIIDQCSVLDGIGDPKKTLENQQYMEKRGVKPIPCFHYGDDESYLEHYIKNYDYISLGGMVPISTPQLILWLDRIWSRYLVDENHAPRVKVHGFGLTVFDILRRYPWYSVDSTVWQQAGSMGGLIVPPKGWKISVSDQAPTRKKHGQHVDTFAPPERAMVKAAVETRGFSFERMQATYLARWAYNLNALEEINIDLETKTAKGMLVFRNEQMNIWS